MGIWAGIFGWRALFRWDVLAAIVPEVFLAVGLALLGIEWFPHNLSISQVCIAIAGLLCAIKVVGYAVESKGAIWARVVFAAILSVFALSLCGWFIAVVQGRKNVSKAENSLPSPVQRPAPLSHGDKQPSPSPEVRPINTPESKRKAPVSATPPQTAVSISGKLTQTTNAPCSGNSVTGSVDNTGCTAGYVPPPNRVIQQSLVDAAVGKLKTAPPGSTVSFVVIGSSQEISHFEGSLERIFTAGEWRIVGRSFIGQAVFVQVGNDGVQRSQGEGFSCQANGTSGEIAIKALELAGYPCGSGFVASHGAQADIVIQVGTRIPPQE